MKTLLGTVAAGALTAFLATGASASPLFQVSISGGGGPPTVINDNGAGDTNTITPNTIAANGGFAAGGGFVTYSVTASAAWTGYGAGVNLLSDTTTIIDLNNLTAATATLTVMQTLSGLNSAAVPYNAFADFFASNPTYIFGAPGDATFTTTFEFYYGSGAFQTTNLLCNSTIGCSNLAQIALLADPFSLTLVQTITATTTVPASVIASINTTASESVSAVPEPASLALLGTGLLAAGFAFARRRRPSKEIHA